MGARTQIERRQKEIIAGHVCSTGIAVHENGMETLFYYTTDPIGIVSPLNGFISPKEKINVMAVFGEIQFQGSSVKSNILLKLEEILEKTLDNQFFQLPDKAPIKDVKSMDEFIIQRRRLKRS